MNNNKFKFEIPRLIKGDVARDERGAVSFVNKFDFPKIKRFYVVANRRARIIRAWHGHKYEAKYVYVISGKALIGAVRIDNWNYPSRKNKIYKFSLSSKKPSILYIPEGYANGFMSLTNNTKLIFFSTKTLDESKKDDIRFEAKCWNIWD